MSQAAYSDAALVVLGHGSTRQAGSAEPVYQHAASLRRRNVFASVHEAFWKQEPQIKTVLGGLAAPRVFIAPLFISRGHFGADVIPRELGFESGPTTVVGGCRRFYLEPVGTHQSMTDVLLARARGVVALHPFPRPPAPPDITLFIAGHGTTRNENSRAAVERQVELIRARSEYAAVHGLYLDEEPGIGECYRLAATRNIVVVPFFISDGQHVREDIPILLGEPPRLVQQRLANGTASWHNPTERKGQRVWLAGAVGTEPGLADVILERVREAAQPAGH